MKNIFEKPLQKHLKGTNMSFKKITQIEKMLFGYTECAQNDRIVTSPIETE